MKIIILVAAFLVPCAHVLGAEDEDSQSIFEQGPKEPEQRVQWLENRIVEMRAIQRKKELEELTNKSKRMVELEFERNVAFKAAAVMGVMFLLACGGFFSQKRRAQR